MGSGEGVNSTLMSDTLWSNGHTGTGGRTGVWFHHKPKELIVSVSEECSDGEGGDVYPTLMVSDTL